MLFKFALKNIFSKKSSFVIILFIAFAIMMLVVTNAVFDSTERGIQEAYIGSFTGDIVVRPKSAAPLSLFGDETPVTGELSDLPTLFPYDDLKEYVRGVPGVELIMPQFTGVAQVESGARHFAGYLFGVNGDEYVRGMTSLRIVEGEPYRAGEKGMMLSRTNAERLNAGVGKTVQFAVSDGFASRIRAATVTAVYEYPVENAILERIVLVDPATVKALLDVSDMSTAAVVELSDEQAALFGEFDIDSLFAEDGDLDSVVLTDTGGGAEGAADGGAGSAPDANVDSSTWNFIICRLSDSARTKKTIRAMNAHFKEMNWEAEAVGWRSAAGSVAFYLYVLRLILNIGIIVVLAAGFIVVNNTLVINVLDRIREIGTLRAIGATKRFVSAECMIETVVLAVIAGVLGCVLGCIASAVVTAFRITFHNSFLIQLFGNGALVTSITARNLGNAFLLAVVIGLIAWVYPVFNALKVNPVTAMQGAK